MSAIKSVQEIMRERIDECTESVSAKFLPAVRPIYGSTEEGSPEHIGTCTLLHFDEDKYLVTAAHVIDHNTDNDTTLYFGGAAGQTLIEIEANFWATGRPGKDRKKDHYDFAIWKMPQHVIDALGNVKYFEDTDIADDRVIPAGRSYLGLGYPNSKNKKLDIPNRHVPLVPWIYSGTVKPNEQLAKKLGISGRDHFFLDFNKKHSRGTLPERLSIR